VLRRFQRVGILASTAAYCAVMVSMGLYKHFSASDLGVLAACRMLCLTGMVVFCLPVVRSVRLRDKVAGAFGVTVVASLLLVSDAWMLAAVLISGTDDSRWSAWVGLPFVLGFYGAFVVIPLALTTALAGTRFAKPLWKNTRTSENLMWWHRQDEPK